MLPSAIVHACDFSGFFQISGFIQISLCLQICLKEEQYPPRKERSSLYCLWGCGELVNLPKLNIQEVHGALSSRPKGDPGPLPIFQDFFTDVKSRPWLLYLPFKSNLLLYVFKDFYEQWNVYWSLTCTCYPLISRTSGRPTELACLIVHNFLFVSILFWGR